MTLEHFGERLKKELRLKHITYAKLAEKVQTSESLIYSLCNGIHLPRLDTAVRICNAADLSLDALLRDEE